MDKQYLDYALGQLKSILAIPSPSGFTHQVAAYLMNTLEALGYTPQKTAKGGVLASLGGGAEDDALLLCCHVDTLGAMVAEVKANGQLRLSPIGGLMATNTEAENLRVHTREGKTYSGTFQLVNPSAHVNPEAGKTERTFDNMQAVLDEKVKTADETRALGIAVGDFVSFDPRTTITESGYIKSRFLDDKLSSAILLTLAKQLKEAKLAPKRRVYLHFTVYEEVGHGAAASVPPGVSEILAVDMGCVGEGLSCDETMVSICAKDSAGPSSYEMVNTLVEIAKEKQLPYGLDVYPQYGSDADAALRAGYDMRHCVVGAGVNASHGYERSHVEGLAATYDLVLGYLLR